MAIEKTQVTTGKVRLSYEHLLKPYANQPGQEEKFSATFLIPKSDVATKSAIDAAINAAIEAGTANKWGGVRPPQPPIPIHDGDGVRQSGEAFGPECKGCWVITASSKQQQEIVDASLQPILQATEIYSGMYVRSSLNFFAYNSNGKKGIGCGLGPVQKLEDGEALGGHISAAEAFGASAPMPQYTQQPQPQTPVYPQYPQQSQPQAPAYPSYPQAPQYAQSQAPVYPQNINPITGQPM